MKLISPTRLVFNTIKLLKEAVFNLLLIELLQLMH